MSLWQTVTVNKWRRLDNPEVMGYEVAREAKEIADFFESIQWMTYDEYSTNRFTVYVEGLIRGYQFNTQDYENMHIATTFDLHNVSCNSMGLHDFDRYLSRRWENRMMFALAEGI